VSGESPHLAIDIEKRLGSFRLCARFAVGHGELIVLFGHSGSGKSVTLRAIAGLIRPDAGRIAIGGATVFDAARHIDLPPQRRGVGMVVQNYALFPHMSVAENIAFGLQGLRAADRRTRVAELAEFLRLDGLVDRRPHAISGGQAQRVALARALAPRPRLLLLDEPFSALDSAIRVSLRRELARLKRELDLTIVFVTHDLREAYNLADRIAVFDTGNVLQVGTRDEVFNHPASGRVARITDVRNVWRGRVTATDSAETLVDTGRFVVRGSPSAYQPGDAVDVCVRPERVVLVRHEPGPDDNTRDSLVTADLVEEVAHGASYTLFFRVRGEHVNGHHDVEVDVSTHVYEALGVRTRPTWTLAFPRDAVHVMAPG